MEENHAYGVSFSRLRARRNGGSAMKDMKERKAADALHGSHPPEVSGT